MIDTKALQDPQKNESKASRRAKRRVSSARDELGLAAKIKDIDNQIEFRKT